MNTAIREIRAGETAPASEAPHDDLGFDSVPRVRRAHRGGLRALDGPGRAVADRRPRASRPGGTVELYRRGPVHTPAARRPRGSHPVPTVEQAQLGFAVLAVAALLSALVVVALFGLAHWRAGTFEEPAHSTSIPAEIGQQSHYGDFPR
ncbi:hypothetical protein SAMN04244553_6454 [Nocardia amikacinitolerans]|uniref:Uncharacterized protein n=1 Tax=Nocardia amikacinitolerans TaxID=756689 RepID=A0A285M1M0_9NOCA|nr:hypothetical protein [Nocardia amikacinitolerans]SNY89441.1 hypothetical protein SAMN04244553_6454 [Nocardia amikacinitolerans]